MFKLGCSLIPQLEGSIREKTDLEVQTLIEIMAQNEYCVEIEQSEKGVLGVNENSIILASQTLMSKQIEALSKQVQAISIRQVQVQQIQQPQTKPTALEEALTIFIKLTQTNFQEIKSNQESV